MLLVAAVASWITADRLGSTPLRWAGGIATGTAVAVSLVAIAAWFPRPVGTAIAVVFSALSAIALITLTAVELWPSRFEDRIWDQPLQAVIGGLIALLGLVAAGLTSLKVWRGRVRPGVGTILVLVLSLVAWFGAGFLLGAGATLSGHQVEFVPEER